MTDGSVVDTERPSPRISVARCYPPGANSVATTICPREVVLNRISFNGW
jgi:hypothetical protein